MTTNRQHEAAFRQMIRVLPAPTQQLALGARALILDVLPGTFEIVWPTQKTAGYGTGPKKMTEHFCYLTFAAAHVGLGFYYGAELPDPAQLLEGDGKRMRRMKIAAAADLKRPALRALIRTATTHRVPPLPT